MARGLLSPSIVSSTKPDAMWAGPVVGNLSGGRLMKRLLKKLEAAMAAIAFAEEGEVETARRIMADVGMDQAAAPQEKQADSPSTPRRPALASSSDR